MPARRPYPELFALSLAAILLEVAYTRVFSFKLFYYFTYLVIGIALLGLGAGGVLVAISPRLRRLTTAQLVSRCAIAGGAAVLIGYVVIARTRVDAIALIGALADGRHGAAAAGAVRLAVLCAALQAPFVAVGVALAGIFARHVPDVRSLYGADLLGAALGCAIAVPCIAIVTPPGTVFLAGFLITLTALSGRRTARVAAPLAAVLLAGAVLPGRLPDPVPDAVKTLGAPGAERQRPLVSRWSPVFRVDVTASPFDPERVYVLDHDGMWGSLLTRWDGDPASLGRFDHDPRAYPFRLLAPAPRVAIIGAAGGGEILAALHFDAGQVTAVELNPVTVSLLRGRFADFTGHLATHPRVRLVNAEGRSFLAASDAAFDLIWLVAPDSYAAMNAATSGAFVLSESYLYTSEMIAQSLAHLASDGILCAQFGEVSFEKKPNRTARFVATARRALEEAGVTDASGHVLVVTSPGFGFAYSTILVRRAAFTAADVERLVATTQAIPDAKIRWAPGLAVPETAVTRSLTLPAAARAAWAASEPYDVSPVTDDAPFFWHFVRFRDAVGGAHSDRVDLEDATGERLLLVLVGASAVFAAVFLLLPLAALGPAWRAVPGKGVATAYFAAIGAGFMFFEVTLIQRLTLFLGYPTHSLTVTLFALLLATGVGSLASGPLVRRPAGVALLVAALGVLVAGYELGMAPLLHRLAGASFAWRVAVAIALVAPLGLCLGAFMPLGLATVGQVGAERTAFVAWSWAVNGFASVTSSVLATILAMQMGFDAVMRAALGLYVVAAVALAVLRRRVPAHVGAAADGIPDAWAMAQTAGGTSPRGPSNPTTSRST